MRPITLLAAIIVAVFTSAASAQISYISQTRSIEAFAGFVDPPQTVSASNFGVFDQTLDITGQNPDGQPASNGFGYQHSELLASSVSMSGRLGGTDSYPYGGFGEGAGYSLLDVTFSLSQPAPFHLAASESRNPGAATEWAIILYQGSTTLFDWEAKPFSSISLTIDGTLQPGTYRLYGAWYDGWRGTGTGTRFSDYSLAMLLPEPASALPLLLLGGFCRRSRSR